MSEKIYKLVSQSQWKTAEKKGRFDGAEIDLTDGYIHFSAADQVIQTAALYFAGQTDLLLVAVEPAKLGDDLKWEPSRAGDLFPHLYAKLHMSDVVSVVELPLDDQGNHIFPEL